MPDKPLTVLTYAASASLAAVALVYFFNPNYLLDGDPNSSANARKKGVVGLFNPANDCFINCVLQALSGLGDLRLFLIRETHRRGLGSREVYESTVLKDEKGRDVHPQKLASLQKGEVTQGLKEMVDKLNERPIYKKTISAAPFIRVLEHAFGTRIAKTQQDAQELLQIVAERLAEEYVAGNAARLRAQKLLRPGEKARSVVNIESRLDGHPEYYPPAVNGTIPDETEDIENPEVEEEGFPLEGQTETRIECHHCHFIPKVTPSSFVMLTLSVPQKSSTSLNECFDGHFKREVIDDYICDRCRLVHAVQSLERRLSQLSGDIDRLKVQTDITKLEKAIREDPEKVPKGITLPDSKMAPRRKIDRHVEITRFPKILVVHLSRSIFDSYSNSTKNLSKVSFPERLPIGGLLNRRNYKLLGVVCHKGTHHSGHYETFRRQHLYAPYSNPHLDRTTGPYSPAATPTHSANSTPVIMAESSPPPGFAGASTGKISPLADPGSTYFPSQSQEQEQRSSVSTRPTSGSSDATTLAKTAETLSPTKTSISSTSAPKNRFSMSSNGKSFVSSVSPKKKRRKSVDRWWRISDDKIKECKTSDVLDMQKEVYLLFYEMEKDFNV